MILLHLSLHDLLLSRRVCTTWRKVHDGFEKIKIALFFKPYGNYTANLQQSKSSIPSDSWTTPKAWVASTGRVMVHKPAINPFLNGFVKTKHVQNGAYGSKVYLHNGNFLKGIVSERDDLYLHNRRFLKDDPEEIQPEWLERFHKDLASSWRRMLFTQPAMSLYSGWCAKHLKHFSIDCTVQDNGGMKVGMVHDMLSKHLKDCESCNIYQTFKRRWIWHAGEDVNHINKDITGWETFKEI
jgi:hypothetical protein